MYNIFILNENITNGFNDNTLGIIGVMAVICGAFVIISKNPIVSVLFLIGLFLSISMYLMLLGVNFIGLSYLLVYVGAVSILFLFILMLINVRISEIVSTTSNSIPLGIFIGVLFFSTVNKALPVSINIYVEQGDIKLNPLYNTLNNLLLKYYYSISNFFNNIYDILSFNFNTKLHFSENILYLSYSQSWDNMLAEVSHINTLGNILYTSFALWILLTSLILLLAMVGAILITLKN